MRSQNLALEVDVVLIALSEPVLFSIITALEHAELHNRFAFLAFVKQRVYRVIEFSLKICRLWLCVS